ncbi:MAG: hypothetical protein NZ866_00640, partial [Patescibacteria group bacterium]|nr:hypothetical protein [Patescibacteria group bacterium]
LSTETKISTLNLIKNLDNNYQDKILIIYLLSGIYFLKFNIIHPIINLKKILLKYYHDIGGFEVNTWGLKIKIDLFKELINRKDIKKILSSNKKEIKWQDFYMLSYF